MKWVWTVALGGVLWVQGVWGDCVQTGPCSCQDPKGDIDLSPLDGHSSPRYKDQKTSSSTDGYLYSWNPCSPFTELSCQSVSACQVSSDFSQSHPVGTQDSASFVTDSTTQDLTLQYTATDPSTGEMRTLSVLLVCQPTATPGSLNVVGQMPGYNTYSMVLNSYYCCPGAKHDGGGTEGALSVGSVLVIVFVSAVLVYVVAGVLFLKFVRKAEGREVIPNYTVWIVLPGLIKDGALFTFRRALSLCGREGAYQKI